MWSGKTGGAQQGWAHLQGAQLRAQTVARLRDAADPRLHLRELLRKVAALDGRRPADAHLRAPRRLRDRRLQPCHLRRGRRLTPPSTETSTLQPVAHVARGGAHLGGHEVDGLVYGLPLQLDNFRAVQLLQLDVLHARRRRKLLALLLEGALVRELHMARVSDQGVSAMDYDTASAFREGNAP